jgi:hypothetical protein
MLSCLRIVLELLQRWFEELLRVEKPAIAATKQEPKLEDQFFELIVESIGKIFLAEASL